VIVANSISNSSFRRFARYNRVLPPA